MLELILILFALFIAVSIYWYKQLPSLVLEDGEMV